MGKKTNKLTKCLGYLHGNERNGIQLESCKKENRFSKLSEIKRLFEKHDEMVLYEKATHKCEKCNTQKSLPARRVKDTCQGYNVILGDRQQFRPTYICTNEEWYDEIMMKAIEDNKEWDYRKKCGAISMIAHIH